MVVESIKNSKVPSKYEIIGLVLGIVGALILVIPDLLAKVFCCCLVKKEQVGEIDNELTEKLRKTDNTEIPTLRTTAK